VYTKETQLLTLCQGLAYSDLGRVKGSLDLRTYKWTLWLSQRHNPQQ